mmetsp:Transcript_2281/g.5424  ORF Transcript_2281/g.5424 Transcript_2281/m.5424 type:complete len:261 (-) Transcript_2281:153-935(-)
MARFISVATRFSMGISDDVELLGVSTFPDLSFPAACSPPSLSPPRLIWSSPCAESFVLFVPLVALDPGAQEGLVFEPPSSPLLPSSSTCRKATLVLILVGGFRRGRGPVEGMEKEVSIARSWLGIASRGSSWSDERRSELLRWVVRTLGLTIVSPSAHELVLSCLGLGRWCARSGPPHLTSHRSALSSASVTAVATDDASLEGAQLRGRADRFDVIPDADMPSVDARSCSVVPAASLQPPSHVRPSDKNVALEHLIIFSL